MVDLPKLNLEYPIFKGMGLVDDKRAHACWYYAVLAQKNYASVGKGPESQIIVVDAAYNDAMWLDKRYEQINKSVAILYGFATPDLYMNYKDHVIDVARKLDPPIEFAPEIWYPPRLLSTLQ